MQSITLNLILFFHGAITSLTKIFVFFQYQFTIDRRSFILIFQHIIDHIDNDLFGQYSTSNSLTIDIYLNRPSHYSVLDLSVIGQNMRRLLYRFLPHSIYELFEIFCVEIHFEVCNPYRVERVEIVERPIVI